MSEQVKTEAKNILKTTGLSIETGVPSPRGGRMTVFHMQFMDPEEIAHQASFGVLPNHAEGVMKSFKRMAPVVPLPAGEKIESRPGEEGGNDPAG